MDFLKDFPKNFLKDFLKDFLKGSLSGVTLYCFHTSAIVTLDERKNTLFPFSYWKNAENHIRPGGSACLVRGQRTMCADCHAFEAGRQRTMYVDCHSFEIWRRGPCMSAPFPLWFGDADHVCRPPEIFPALRAACSVSEQKQESPPV